MVAISHDNTSDVTYMLSLSIYLRERIVGDVIKNIVRNLQISDGYLTIKWRLEISYEEIRRKNHTLPYKLSFGGPVDYDFLGFNRLKIPAEPRPFKSIKIHVDV